MNGLVMALLFGVVSGIGASPADAASAVTETKKGKTWLEVTWSPPPGSTNFELYLNGEYKASTNAKRHQFKGLTANRTYTVRIDGWINGTKFNVGSTQVTTRSASQLQRSGLGNNPTNPHGDPNSPVTDNPKPPNIPDNPNDVNGNPPGNNPTNPNADPNQPPTDNPSSSSWLPAKPGDPVPLIDFRELKPFECPMYCGAFGIGIGAGSGRGKWAGPIALGCTAACLIINGHIDSPPANINLKVYRRLTPGGTWTKNRHVVNQWIYKARSKGMSDRVINRGLNEIGQSILDSLPNECFTGSGAWRGGYKDCSKGADLFLAGRDLKSWQIDPRGSGSGAWPSESPRPIIGNFRCTANGYRYYSNGTNAYRQHGDDGYTPCPGVVFDLHVYKNNKVVKVIKGSNGSGGSATGPQKVNCSTGRQYTINGNKYWQQTEKDRLKTCPDSEFRGKQYMGWRWSPNGRDLATSGG